MTSDEEAEGRDPFDPCVMFRERRGDVEHWMNPGKVRIVHHANRLGESSHYEVQQYTELAGPVPLGTVRLLELDFQWCKECFPEFVDDLEIEENQTKTSHD